MGFKSPANDAVFLRKLYQSQDYFHFCCLSQCLCCSLDCYICFKRTSSFVIQVISLSVSVSTFSLSLMLHSTQKGTSTFDILDIACSFIELYITYCHIHQHGCSGVRVVYYRLATSCFYVLNLMLPSGNSKLYRRRVFCLLFTPVFLIEIW